MNLTIGAGIDYPRGAICEGNQVDRVPLITSEIRVEHIRPKRQRQRIGSDYQRGIQNGEGVTARAQIIETETSTTWHTGGRSPIQNHENCVGRRYSKKAAA